MTTTALIAVLALFVFYTIAWFIFTYVLMCLKLNMPLPNFGPKNKNLPEEEDFTELANLPTPALVDMFDKRMGDPFEFDINRPKNAVPEPEEEDYSIPAAEEEVDGQKEVV